MIRPARRDFVSAGSVIARSYHDGHLDRRARLSEQVLAKEGDDLLLELRSPAARDGMSRPLDHEQFRIGTDGVELLIESLPVLDRHDPVGVPVHNEQGRIIG